MKPLIAAALILAATEGAAQTTSHTGHAMPTETPSTKGYVDASAQMHDGMGATQYTGNADVDFIAGMIPHHQGAVDMAKVVLQHGKDPEVRTLAEKVIAAQEAEIAWMQDWLAKNRP